MEGDHYFYKFLFYSGMVLLAVICLFFLPEKWDPAIWFKEWVDATNDPDESDQDDD